MDRERGMNLAKLFWLVAGSDIAIVLMLLWKTATGPANQYDWLVEFLFLGIIALVAAMMGIVALIRNPLAYGIGLALAAAPLLYYGGEFVRIFVTTPSEKALEAGHGYFKNAAD